MCEEGREKRMKLNEPGKRKEDRIPGSRQSMQSCILTGSRFLIAERDL